MWHGSNMGMRRARGFTLIELLVVVAVIAVLLALILVAIGNARDKAKDARVRQDLDQIRSLAEVYRTNDRGYIGFDNCFDPALLPAACGGSDGITLRNDLEEELGSKLHVSSSTYTYCAHARLSDDSWSCIDNISSTILENAACESPGGPCRATPWDPPPDSEGTVCPTPASSDGVTPLPSGDPTPTPYDGYCYFPTPTPTPIPS